MTLRSLPVHKTANDRREAIIGAAKDLFIRSGFLGTNMDLVAEAAGVSRRTVFNHFKSKDALFEAVIADLWTSLTITDEQRWSEISDPRAGLTKLATEIVEFWADPGSVAMLTMVIAESLRSPRILREFTRAGKEPAFRATVRYLEKLAERGILTVEDTTLAANQFIGLLNEPLLWSQVLGLTRSPPREQRRKVIQAAVDVFLSHYEARRGAPVARPSRGGARPTFKGN